MVLVLLFLVLFLSLLGVAWRRIGSVLRVASVRTVQLQRDEGSLGALAAAMNLLETGRPPTSPSPCVYRKSITLASGEIRYFLVAFQRDATPPPQNTSPQETWSVKVTRQNAQPSGIEDMPVSFTP
jgi:hypothetical protein